MNTENRRPGEGDGIGNHLADDDRCPSKNVATAQVESNAIGLLMPHLNEDERQLRQALRNAQTWAAARAVHTHSDNARTILWMISDTASRWQFAPAACEDLTRVRHLCLRLRLASNDFEQLDGCHG